VIKFCVWLEIQDVITCATFADDRLRGLGVARDRIFHFHIELHCPPYNTLTLPCECVIRHAPIPMVWASDSPMFWTSYLCRLMSLTGSGRPLTLCLLFHTDRWTDRQTDIA